MKRGRWLVGFEWLLRGLWIVRWRDRREVVSALNFGVGRVLVNVAEEEKKRRVSRVEKNRGRYRKKKYFVDSHMMKKRFKRSIVPEERS